MTNYITIGIIIFLLGLLYVFHRTIELIIGALVLVLVGFYPLTPVVISHEGPKLPKHEKELKILGVNHKVLEF